MALATVSELKTRLGIAVSTYDTALSATISAVTAAIQAYLGFDPEATSVTEYLSTRGTFDVSLKRWPVSSITSVHLDESAYFGTVSGSFASTTELVSGVDYALEVLPSQVGILRRINARWPWKLVREPLKLTTLMTDCPGCLKVVYTVSNTQVLAAASEAAYMESTARYRSMATGMGPAMSDSMDGASVRYEKADRNTTAVHDACDGFMSPFVAYSLRPFRSVRFV